MSEMDTTKIAVPTEKAEEYLKAVRDAGYDADLSEDPESEGEYMCMTVTGDRLWELKNKAGICTTHVYTNSVLDQRGYEYYADGHTLTFDWFKSEVSSRVCPLCLQKLEIKSTEVGYGCQIDSFHTFGCKRCGYWFNAEYGQAFGAANRKGVQEAFDRFDKLTVLTEEGLMLMTVGAKVVAESQKPPVILCQQRKDE